MAGTNVLAGLELTNEQMAALKTKLDEWKLTEKKEIEAKLTEKYEMMEAQLKDDNEQMVGELKENLKQVYSKRFKKALAECYQEIKAQVMVEHLSSPEVKAMDEVKTAVYPFINDSTARRYRDEFKKLAGMYNEAVEDLSKLKGAVKKGKLIESLSPDVRQVVAKLIGEGTEEEIVERFATIKQAMKESLSTGGPLVAENRAPAPAAKPRATTVEEDITEDNEDYDNLHEEDELLIKPTLRDQTNEDRGVAVDDSEFMQTLNEQLILAGLKKAR
jgi:hypothetical protein